LLVKLLVLSEGLFMSTNKAGALRSQIQMELHTNHAGRIWSGRGIESGKAQIIGMKQFLQISGQIRQNAAKDDPYADNWLLILDEKIQSTTDRFIAQETRLESLFTSLPGELHVNENLNQSPILIPVFTGGQHGYLGIQLLIRFDRLVRQTLLAHHVALMGRQQCEAVIQESGRAIRSLCACLRKYGGYSGTTRDDFASNNAKARDAIEKFGELPADVLRGDRRSDFAPALLNKPSIGIDDE
jgi:integrating conjugative element protein (TIGR03761 family)